MDRSGVLSGGASSEICIVQFKDITAQDYGLSLERSTFSLLTPQAKRRIDIATAL
jgi:hypothetical protein